MAATIRQKLGCWANERWRFELAVRAPSAGNLLGLSWLDLRNRSEQIKKDPISGGRSYAITDSSSWTAAKVFPDCGSRLLRHCLQEWPIDLATAAAPAYSGDPDLSIIVGVRGTNRVPQFSACLASLRSQVGVKVEIIVVEQSLRCEFESRVPADVCYLHQAFSDPTMPYNRAWALNAGARLARGRFLLLHDADMLLPRQTAASTVKFMDRGLDGLRLPRFLFYLDQATSAAIQSEGTIPRNAGLERVVANNRTPVAVRRDAYLAIGGHDEAYFGWGSEDDEFMDRLRSLRVAEGSYLPIVHLWHASAAAGPSRSINALKLANARSIPLALRIQELTARPFGREQPSVPWLGTNGS